MRRSAIAVGICLALVAAACSGGSNPEPQSESVPDDAATATTTATASRCLEAEASEPDLGDLEGELVLDRATDVRRLDNGLTVSVRENDAPGERASLALVVRAGSFADDPEHRGTAHFLEHMLFNGTERFPGNELVQELERFGSVIGPDLNAYTSYDETVYMLELPDVRSDTRELGIDVLREWAGNATLDRDEIEAEYGVIQEERRLRTESGDGRVGLAFEDFLLEGTPYEDVDTIGTEESIDEMTREALLSYYESWYQPQNMAVVAVGDFDVDEMHDLIEDRFSDLEEAGVPDPANSKVEPWTEPRYVGIVESELPAAGGSIGFTISEPTPSTGEGRRDTVLVEVTMQVVANRLSEAISLGEAPLSEASSSTAFPLRGLLGPTIDFSAPSKDLRSAVEVIVREFEQVCRFGVTDDELDRVLDQRRAEVDAVLDGEDSKQDGQHADDLRSHFLMGRVTPEAERMHELDRTILDSIAAEDVNAWFGGLYASMQPSILVAGTSDEDVPSVEELAEIVGAAADLELDDREEDDTSIDELMEPPEPVEPVNRSEIEAFEETEFPAVILEYGNGIRVIVQPTTIATGSVEVYAESPGGSSALDDDDVAVAHLVTSRDFGDAVTQSGVGDFDQVALSRLLSGTSIEVVLSIEEELDMVQARASTDEAEMMLALVHFYLTEPRVTEAALNTIREQMRPLVEDPESDPEFAMLSRLAQDRFPNEPRYQFLPSAELFDGVDAEAASAVVRDRFVEGGDFTFVIVGDIELDDAEELASRYLGTLPGAEPERWTDVMSVPPSAAVHSTVRAGAGDQGGVAALYSTESDLELTTRLAVPVADALVDTRLREVIREELGLAYSPSVSVELVDLPRGHIFTFAQVMGDPNGIGEVASVLEGEMAALASGDFSDDEFDRALETVTTDSELWSNGSLAEMHHEHQRNSDWSYENFVGQSFLVRRLDRSDIEELLRRMLDPASLVEVQLLPAD